MAGTSIGGQKAAAANLAKDPDFYKKLGAKGGKISSNGGWYHMSISDPERFRELSAKGGTISRRGRSVRQVAD